MTFDVSAVIDAFPVLADGLWTTLLLVLGSLAIGSAIASFLLSVTLWVIP